MTISKRIISILIVLLMAQQVLSMSRTSTQHNSNNDNSVLQQHKNLRVHTFSPSVSNQLSTAIKQKIISNLPKFSDQVFAQQLKQDLNQDKDSQRKLKQISVRSVQQLFGIFGLTGIKCDSDNDGIITKLQLQCLNFIWKYYVPQDNQINL